MAKRILVCERCQAVCKRRHTCRTCKRLCCENGCCTHHGDRYGGETWWGCYDEGECATRDLPPEAYRPKSPPWVCLVAHDTVEPEHGRRVAPRDRSNVVVRFCVREEGVFGDMELDDLSVAEGHDFAEARVDVAPTEAPTDVVSSPSIANSPKPTPWSGGRTGASRSARSHRAAPAATL